MGDKAAFAWHLEGDGQERKVRIEGELDFGTAAEFDRALRSAVATGAKELRLDLSGVTFIDSEAIKVVLAVTHELMQRDGNLLLVAWSSTVHRALSILGLEALFETADTGA